MSSDKLLRQQRSADGREIGVWNHSNPRAGVDVLLPSIVSRDGIELEKTPVESSTSLLNDLLRRGVDIKRVENPFNNYREATYLGKNRLLDNSDCLVGKEQLYDDLEHFRRVYSNLRELTKNMLNYYEPVEGDSIIAQMEMEDLNKITIQQWKPTGWHLQSPITDAAVPKNLDVVAKSAMASVFDGYGDVLRKLPQASQSWEELVMQDDDPPDTMTGAPLFASGAASHEARITVLSAMPDPRSMTPVAYLSAVARLEATLGIGAGRLLASCLSTRHGPMKKPVKLWTKQEQGYVTMYSSVAAYDRTRFVYPASYALNFMLSPLYVQLSSVRKHKLGLWHDPDSQEQYLEVLKKQGSYAYSIDFTGMDTGMFGPIIKEILRNMIRCGFCRWSSELFLEAYSNLKILLPDYFGDRRFMMEVTGDVKPWCSGFKLTSEFDTVYGLSVILGALEDQIPGIIQAWKRGSFVLLELGDDIFFTLPKPIDVDRLAKHASVHWGAKLKCLRDAMFLKWFLPVVPEVPKKTRSLSRFLQQTFFNEDRYTGGEGGDKPDAILRLGLQARMEGLVNHPHISRWWPQIWSVVSQLGYIRRASEAYRSKLSRCEPTLDDGDVLEILKFSQRVPTYMEGLKERAKYEPSAALLLEVLERDGVKMTDNPASELTRKAYLKALTSDPTSTTIQNLKSAIHKRSLNL